jgi:transcriptional regulator with XRE-family HTH domain
MPSAMRLQEEARRRTRRQLDDIGSELLEGRLTLNLSQQLLAEACGMSRKHYGQIERGSNSSLTIAELNRIAAVLGLMPSIRVYPGGVSVRDVASATRLQRFLAEVRHPLTFRLEVALPVVEGRLERRAWDAVVYRDRERCAVELEMRLRDVQQLRRRFDLKRRDDPTESFLLLIADTRHNRRVLAAFDALFADLPRLRPSQVRTALAEGRLPPTGILLI